MNNFFKITIFLFFSIITLSCSNTKGYYIKMRGLINDDSTSIVNEINKIMEEQEFKLVTQTDTLRVYRHNYGPLYSEEHKVEDWIIQLSSNEMSAIYSVFIKRTITEISVSRGRDGLNNTNYNTSHKYITYYGDDDTSEDENYYWDIRKGLEKLCKSKFTMDTIRSKNV